MHDVSDSVGNGGPCPESLGADRALAISSLGRLVKLRPIGFLNWNRFQKSFGIALI